MAEPEIDKKEQQFRSKLHWLSFKSSTLGSFAMASFFGALSALASGAVWAVAKAFSIGGEGNMMHAAGDVVTNLPTLGVIAGLMTVGLICSYFAQHNATELEVLRGSHQAEEQAKCIQKAKSHSVEQVQEHEQNCRSDGKKWTEALAANQNIPEHAAAR